MAADDALRWAAWRERTRSGGRLFLLWLDMMPSCVRGCRRRSHLGPLRPAGAAGEHEWPYPLSSSCCSASVSEPDSHATPGSAIPAVRTGIDVSSFRPTLLRSSRSLRTPLPHSECLYPSVMLEAERVRSDVWQGLAFQGSGYPPAFKSAANALSGCGYLGRSARAAGPHV